MDKRMFIVAGVLAAGILFSLGSLLYGVYSAAHDKGEEQKHH
jgi:hypothetical protein